MTASERQRIAASAPFKLHPGLRNWTRETCAAIADAYLPAEGTFPQGAVHEAGWMACSGEWVGPGLLLAMVRFGVLKREPYTGADRRYRWVYRRVAQEVIVERVIPVGRLNWLLGLVPGAAVAVRSGYVHAEYTRAVVERVTDTLLLVDGVRYQKTSGIALNGTSTPRQLVELTPEVVEAIERRRLLRKFQEMDWSRWSLADLQRVDQIVGDTSS